MIQVLYSVVLGEAAVIVAILSKSLIRKPAIMALENLRNGRGLVILRTVQVASLVLLLSGIYTLLVSRRCSNDAGHLTRTDQLRLAQNLLEASFAGIAFFFLMVTNTVYDSVKEHSTLQENIEAEKTLVEQTEFRKARQLGVLRCEVATLKAKINKLAILYKTKANEAKVAQDKALAWVKKSEEIRLKYGNQLEYNQTLQNQLEAIDWSLLKDNQETVWTTWKSNVLWDGLVQLSRRFQAVKRSKAEVGCEDESETISGRRQYFFYDVDDDFSTPWLRHRRPIYQH